MRVIPVIDLKDGLVVRGIACRREEYRPIVSRLVSEPTPRAVAAAFAERFGFGEVYVADLDAIGGQAPNVQAYEEIRSSGMRLWIDAGVGKADMAQDFGGESSLIVGLESLESPEDLRQIVARWSEHRVVFSLDLKSGRPITKMAAWQPHAAHEVAAAAVDCGVRRLIVLDLADVGVGRGTGTLDLVRRVRADHPRLEITAGGGVRGIGDLPEMACAGCDAALVASALHDGRITPDEVQWLHGSTSTTLL